MSRPWFGVISCPKCNHPQEVTCWDSVNVTVDPDLKAKILQHTLTILSCDACGVQSHMVAPLLYHDMEKKLMIWLLPRREPADASVEDEAPKFVCEVAEGYKFRIVRSMNQLIEKILIFDDGRDDKAVELFKLGMRFRHRNLDGTDVYYMGQHSNEQGETMVRIAVARGSDVLTGQVPWADLLPDVVKRMEAREAADEPHWMEVDKGFVSRAID